MIKFILQEFNQIHKKNLKNLSICSIFWFDISDLVYCWNSPGLIIIICISFVKFSETFCDDTALTYLDFLEIFKKHSSSGLNKMKSEKMKS